MDGMVGKTNVVVKQDKEDGWIPDQVRNDINNAMLARQALDAPWGDGREGGLYPGK